MDRALSIAESSPQLQAQAAPAIAAFLDAHAEYIAQHSALPGLADPAKLLHARMLAGRCRAHCAMPLSLMHCKLHSRVGGGCAAVAVHLCAPRTSVKAVGATSVDAAGLPRQHAAGAEVCMKCAGRLKLHRMRWPARLPARLRVTTRQAAMPLRLGSAPASAERLHAEFPQHGSWEGGGPLLGQSCLDFTCSSGSKARLLVHRKGPLHDLLA